MLAVELFEELERPPEPTLIDALRDFLPIAVRHLKLKHLPKIKLLRDVDTEHLPSFGKFSNEDRIVHVDVENRHPNDVLRTLAHELTHYAQGEQNRLDADSWQTGSTIEDEANAEAGVIMREFNKQFPQYMELKPIILPEAWSQKYKKSINCNNPKGFSQRAHCQGRKKNNESADYERDMQSDPSDPIPFPPGTTLVNVSDVYDWYKLGMAVPALDKADPRIFNKGVPHTVFAFGTEEEEHRLAPLLKRLGFTLHDIDKPEDYAKAIRASDVVEHLEKYVAENFVNDEKNTNEAEVPHQHTEIIKHQVGPWTVYIGDHAWARAMTRNIGPRMMSNLISSLVKIPNLDKQVPVGDDFWIKDGKTNSSFYFKRLDIPGEPLAVRCETGVKDEPRAGRRTPVFTVNAYTGPEKPEHVKSMRHAKYVKQFVGVNPLAKDVSTAAKQGTLVPGNPAVITNPETQDSRRYDRAFQQAKKKDMAENFADGKGPGRPGDSQRHGIPKGATMAQLEKAAKAPGRKGQLARWQINMRRGRKK